MRTHMPDEGCRRFKFSKLLSSSFAGIICWCCLLLAENDLDVELHGTLHVVLELPRNSRFDNTSLPGQWRFCVQAQIVRFNSINAFNVRRTSLLDYDHNVVFNISILILMWEIYRFSI